MSTSRSASPGSEAGHHRGGGVDAERSRNSKIRTIEAVLREIWRACGQIGPQDRLCRLFRDAGLGIVIRDAPGRCGPPPPRTRPCRPRRQSTAQGSRRRSGCNRSLDAQRLMQSPKSASSLKPAACRVRLRSGPAAQFSGISRRTRHLEARRPELDRRVPPARQYWAPSPRPAASPWARPGAGNRQRTSPDRLGRRRCQIRCARGRIALLGMDRRNNPSTGIKLALGHR